MELRWGKEGRKTKEKPSEKGVEKGVGKWGQKREVRQPEREREWGAKRWEENEDARDAQKSGQKVPRVHMEKQAGLDQWQQQKWDLERVPEVQGRRMSLWSQSSSTSVFGLRGLRDKEQDQGRRAWDAGWPSQRPPSRPPEITPTHLPRMPQDLEPMSSSTAILQREAGKWLVIM